MSVNNPSISIIMPVHNTPAQYLTECLDSVVAQTFSDWELIIVDDGSDDIETRRLENNYLIENEKITLIELQHSVGAAEARNIGFMEANGKYVIFLDSDDTFYKDFLKKMYYKIEQTHADLGVCGFNWNYYCDEEIVKVEEFLPHTIKNDSVKERLNLPQVPWNKLCLRSFLEENKIDFQTLSSCNDVAFYLRAHIYAKKIAIVQEVLIDYRFGTHFQISAQRPMMNVCRAYEYTIEDAVFRGASTEVLEALLSQYLIYIYNDTKVGRDDAERAYNRCRQYIGGFSIEYEDKKAECINRRISLKGYSVGWAKELEDYKNQIEIFAEDVEREVVIGGKEIVVWGMGKRGKGFLSWAEEKGIKIEGAYDQKMTPDEVQNQFKLEYMTAEQALALRGVIVASNTLIYEEIKDKACGRVVNLEQFCPL